jgi:hypothetical protein
MLLYLRGGSSGSCWNVYCCHYNPCRGYAARYPRAPMRITTRTTRPIVKGDLIVSDLLSSLQVVILIVIPSRRIIGSPHLFGFTSVIWGADGVVRTSSI